MLDQVIVILLSIVNDASKFLEDKEWFKFGVDCVFFSFLVPLATYGITLDKT